MNQENTIRLLSPEQKDVLFALAALEAARRRFFMQILSRWPPAFLSVFFGNDACRFKKELEARWRAVTFGHRRKLREIEKTILACLKRAQELGLTDLF